MQTHFRWPCSRAGCSAAAGPGRLVCQVVVGEGDERQEEAGVQAQAILRPGRGGKGGEEQGCGESLQVTFSGLWTREQGKGKKVVKARDDNFTYKSVLTMNTSRK